jgi:1,4-alpha-glucan branching enzyme
MRIFFTLFLLACLTTAKSQLLSWASQFPNDASAVTITINGNAGNKGLAGFTGPVYMHLGIITNLSASAADWKYVNTTWATTTAPTATPAGIDKWSFTINNPRAFFGVPAGETILKIAVLFRDATGNKVQKNTDGSDTYVPVYVTGYNGVQFTNPALIPTAKLTHEVVVAGVGVSVPVTAVASGSAGTLNLYLNGNKISGPVSATNTISGSATATAKGEQQFVAEYIVNGTRFYDTISYFITPDNVIAALPANAREGINYSTNCMSATLVLYAPNKNHVVVTGDFPGSDWTGKSMYVMNKTPDGNYYWLTINDLVPGAEYAFNYQVDDTIYVADPYSEKVLDPNNDQFISNTTYPNLKPYPTHSNVSAAKNGIVTVLQTCQPAYNWQVTNFTKPEKQNLVTYELLVRDFGNAHNYQMLIDTISYFKRLGINAIELMPVNEFSGNDSWGYNPTFYTALDKYYGTKNKFKEFIDLCHQNGIAVILDVVYNQMEAGFAPQGKLYWDKTNNRPAANNPWLNIAAPHPYFPYQYDLNHESAATKYLVERSLEYWLQEYKVDGFRVDAGKGFTQKCTQVNEMCPVANGSIEDYDASRVAILEHYYDFVQTKAPGSYMILEFLGEQRQEEQEYAKHGLMLWGNNNPTYNQATMGYKENSNFSKIVYNSGEQSFSTPAEMGYMESHDEERLMFKNLAYGNSSGSYNVKNLATALERQAAAASLFFAIPGPKMIWQFGERGYDVSIDANGGRVNAKPPHWEYMQDVNRLALFNTYSKLIGLRLSNPATFNSSNFTYDFYDNGGLFRRFQIAEPNPTGLKVTVVANFELVPQTRTISFQAIGSWFNFVGNGTGAGFNGPAGSAVSITAATQNITLQPGEYHVYLNQQITLPLKLISFSGSRNSDNISLLWKTANEINVRHFVVERSFNGVDFDTIGSVPARNLAETNYAFADKDVVVIKSGKKVYYRLKTVDVDGKSSYSNIAIINPVTSQATFSLYPNPAKGTYLYVNVEDGDAGVFVKIEDLTGRIFSRYTVNNSGQNSAIPIKISALANGVYVMKIQTRKKTYIKQFVVQR